MSLLLIDIDHFKQINDTHGHSAGDQVLASFAHIVRRELRHDQLFGRGGEEFAIMLPRALAAQGVALGNICAGWWSRRNCRRKASKR